MGVLAVLALFALQSGEPDNVALGPAEGQSPGSVVYRASDHVFVIWREDGQPLVLADLDPHSPPGEAACRVTFRPDLGPAGGQGRFFDVCSKAEYDLDGRGLQGDGLDLRRIPFDIDEQGRITVRPEELAPEASGQRQFRGSDAA